MTWDWYSYWVGLLCGALAVAMLALLILSGVYAYKNAKAYKERNNL